MTIESEADVAGLKRIGQIVARTRDALAARAVPGVTTKELDDLGQALLASQGARSAPALLYGFPGAICISVNDELAHGVPSDRRLEAGDLINIDVSAELDGYFADTGASHPVGQVSRRATSLLETTRAALADAMQEARAGRPIRNVGRAVQRRARAAGFQVVETLCGHGVGRHVHEPPSVPNCFSARSRETFWEGLVMTIEPFLTTGARSVYEEEDGWTLKTPDGSWGAQFEHTMIITRGEPIVLTA